MRDTPTHHIHHTPASGLLIGEESALSAYLTDYASMPQLESSRIASPLFTVPSSTTGYANPGTRRLHMRCSLSLLR